MDGRFDELREPVCPMPIMKLAFTSAEFSQGGKPADLPVRQATKVS